MGLTFVYRKRADDDLTSCGRPDSRDRRPPKTLINPGRFDKAWCRAGRVRHSPMAKFYPREADGSIAGDTGQEKAWPNGRAFQNYRKRAVIDGWRLP
jgi:hypothetical protein